MESWIAPLSIMIACGAALGQDEQRRIERAGAHGHQLFHVAFGVFLDDVRQGIARALVGLQGDGPGGEPPHPLQLQGHAQAGQRLLYHVSLQFHFNISLCVRCGPVHPGNQPVMRRPAWS